MYWYVKLVLYLILFSLVFGIVRCSYRRIADRSSEPTLNDEVDLDQAGQLDFEVVDEQSRQVLPGSAGIPSEPVLSPENQRILTAAAAQLDNDNLLGARSLARRVLQSDEVVIFSPAWWKTAEIISQVNTKVVNSDLPAPEKQRYQVRSGDALERIARSMGTTVEAIQRMNNIAPENSRIYPGMTLDIYVGDWSILVSKEHFALVLFDGPELFKVYRVGIGRQDRTPEGTFVVRNKLREPDWTPPGKLIPYGDPENVLGTRWIGLLPVEDTDPTLTGYGIHGTWEPETIGTGASQGCVRMINEEVNELYSLLPHPRVGERTLREDPSRGIIVTIQE